MLIIVIFIFTIILIKLTIIDSTNQHTYTCMYLKLTVTATTGGVSNKGNNSDRYSLVVLVADLKLQN